MEFRDLKRQYQSLSADIDKEIKNVIGSANFIMGKPVMDLEEQLAQYVGTKHCITCANGTDALVLALKALGVKEGDAVFVPDFTFFASAEAVSVVGATPIFVDVDGDTFNISVLDLQQKIVATLHDGVLQPKVILTVDLFGLPVDYAAIRAISCKYGLCILEDGAQGFGGSINGLMACGFGDIATTSFFPSKPLGCYGDGGALFTNNDEWAELAKSYRSHGKGNFKYDNVRIGMNSRLDTLQAAILKVKLKAFAEYELKNINDIAYEYTRCLKDIVHTPVVPEGFYSSWAQYTIVLDDETTRNKVQNELKNKGIPTMVYYPKPLHKQTAYAKLKSYNDTLPITEKLCNTVLSLPISPYLENIEVQEISNALRNAVGV